MMPQFIRVQNKMSGFIWRIHNEKDDPSLKSLTYTLSEALHHQINVTDPLCLMIMPDGWAIADRLGKWAYLPDYYEVIELPWVKRMGEAPKGSEWGRS